MTGTQAEAKRIRLGPAAELPPGSSRVDQVGDCRIALFNVDGNLYAIEDRCPHQGASLAEGSRQGTVVTCPLHQWQFNLQTGKRVGSASQQLKQFEISIGGGDLFVDLSASDERPAGSDGIYRYLVRYGAMGWVSRFGSVDRVECSYGDRVVVHTRRGMEIGDVLTPPAERDEHQGSATEQQPVGEVLRRVTPQDLQASERLEQQEVTELFEACQQRLAERELELQVIDCERLFGGQTIVFYYLGEESSQSLAVAAELGEGWQAEVLFEPVIEPEPAAGCGSGGCGSGGCGSGGCG